MIYLYVILLLVAAEMLFLLLARRSGFVEVKYDWIGDGVWRGYDYDNGAPHFSEKTTAEKREAAFLPGDDERTEVG